MRLTRRQKALWAAATVALVVWMAWGGWQVLVDRIAAGEREAPIRPTFALEDAEGRVVTSADLADRYLLVFFGFTNCPDVCPTTLSEVAQVMDELGEDAPLVQPVFISVDPERDRTLGLGEYTAAFHPAILGLAGSEEATRAAADSFMIYYAREEDAAARDGYMMAHAPELHLIGPEGDWLRRFTYGSPASEILADLRSRL